MNKRTLAERKQVNLTWRQGKFSAEEISKVAQAISEWQHEKNLSATEAADQLRWAKDSGVRAWCDIAHKSGLIFRKIQSIRTCALRHCLSERKKWTPEENLEFVRLQQTLGATSWKAIAQELGRTVEEVQNKGKQFRSLGLNRNPLKNQPSDEALNSEPAALSTDFCDIAAAIVQVCVSHESQLIGIHGIPWPTISQFLTGSGSLSEFYRHKWRASFTREIEALIRAEQISEKIDQFLIWHLYLATKGLLENQPCLAEDFAGVPWQLVCPFFPPSVSQSKLKDILARYPARESFTKTVKTIAKTLNATSETEDLLEPMHVKIQALIRRIASQSNRSFNIPQLLD